MAKYLTKRILLSMFSIVMVVGIVMIMIYSALDKTLIFANDSNFNKVNANTKSNYMQQ